LGPRIDSRLWHKAQFAIALQLVRFSGEADINWQRENAASVANDPMYGPAVRSKKILTRW